MVGLYFTTIYWDEQTGIERGSMYQCMCKVYWYLLLVCLKFKQKISFFVGRIVDRNTGRQQAEVTNLTPWSSYEFSVTAVNILGIGAPSAPSPIYSTHEDKPYIAPRNVGGGGGKIGDLTITWDPLLPQEQHSPGIHYKVFWRLVTDPEWASDVKQNMKNPGVAVVNIPRNNYYTQYEVKVQAMNNVGEGPISQPVVVFSAEDMPQVAPQKPIAYPFNSTAFNVTWQPISLAREHIRGKLIGHRVCHGVCIKILS